MIIGQKYARAIQGWLRFKYGLQLLGKRASVKKWLIQPQAKNFAVNFAICGANALLGKSPSLDHLKRRSEEITKSTSSCARPPGDNCLEQWL
jgi:hypothetical protein